MTYKSMVALVFCLCFPSLPPIERFFGSLGVIVYVVLVSGVVLLANRFSKRAFLPNISERGSVITFSIFMILLSIAFVFLYPIADKGIQGGSDVDDALTVGVRALLDGMYPYYEVTYLGNHPSPLPGALILSIPFYFLGNASFQNIFWLVALFLFLKFYFGEYRVALYFIGMLFVLSPAVSYNIMTGSDYFSNSIYVLIFSYLLIEVCRRDGSHVFLKCGIACLLGVALSSRANFFLILPLVFSVMIRECGLKKALKYSLLAFAILVSITLPFYLYDPVGFYPFKHAAVFTKFARLRIPEINYFVLSSTAIFSAVLCFRLMRNGRSSFLSSCALAQALPVVMLVAIYMIATKSPSFYLSGYSMIFLPFGALASCGWKRVS